MAAPLQHLLLLLLLLQLPLAARAQCNATTYSYGGGTSSCSPCAAGATLISSSLGCAPSAAAAGPSDTVFYLSGSQLEGVAAFSTVGGPPGLSFVANEFDVAASALNFSSGSYLATSPAAASALAAALPTRQATLASWVRCAAQGLANGQASVLEWGAAAAAGSSSKLSLLVTAIGTKPTSSLALPFPVCDGAWHHIALTAVAFAPTVVPGLALWLDGADASTITLAGTSVTQWADKSGRGMNAGALSGYATPHWGGSSGLNFDGATQLLALPDGALPFGNSAYSYIAVVSFASASSSLGIIGGGSWGGVDACLGIRSNGNALATYWWGDDFDTTATFVPGATTIVESFYSGVALGVNARSASLNLGVPSLSTPTGVHNQQAGLNCVGATNDYSELFQGTIYELVVYAAQLSSSDQSAVEAYLAAKYGLSALLPASNPCALGACTKLTAYVDGAAMSQAYTPVALPATGSSSLRVGWNGVPPSNGSTNGGDLFAGALNEMRIYSRALSSTEVLSLSLSRCNNASYTYGSPSCSPCAPYASFVSVASGCAPTPGLLLGPSDTAFYLSGSAAEGFGAFPSISATANISFVTSALSTAGGAMSLVRGSYLSAPGVHVPVSLPTGTSAWSISAWVSCSPTASTYMAVLEWGTAGDYSSQTIALTVASALLPLSTALPVCDGTWHHAAATYSPLSSPTLSTYIDGRAYQNTTLLTTPNIPSATASSLRVGWNGNSSLNNGSLFAGALGELRIYSRALAPNEVLSLAALPLFFPNSTATILASAAGGTVIATVNATGTLPADPLTFSVTGAPGFGTSVSSSTFSVSPNGVVFLPATFLGFGALSYQLIVSFTDSVTGASGSAYINVQVVCPPGLTAFLATPLSTVVCSTLSAANVAANLNFGASALLSSPSLLTANFGAPLATLDANAVALAASLAATPWSDIDAASAIIAVDGIGTCAQAPATSFSVTGGLQYYSGGNGAVSVLQFQIPYYNAVVSSTITFTVDTNVAYVVAGGGGGGGAGNVAGNSGSGGGSGGGLAFGALGESTTTFLAHQPYTITVGAGGLAGVSGLPGGAGGTSSVVGQGVAIVATGGAGGDNATGDGGAGFGCGGAAGTASGGIHNAPGGLGGCGYGTQTSGASGTSPSLNGDTFGFLGSGGGGGGSNAGGDAGSTSGGGAPGDPALVGYAASASSGSGAGGGGYGDCRSHTCQSGSGGSGLVVLIFCAGTTTSGLNTASLATTASSSTSQARRATGTASSSSASGATNEGFAGLVLAKITTGEPLALLIDLFVSSASAAPTPALSFGSTLQRGVPSGPSYLFIPDGVGDSRPNQGGLLSTASPGLPALVGLDVNVVQARWSFVGVPSVAMNGGVAVANSSSVLHTLTANASSLSLVVPPGQLYPGFFYAVSVQVDLAVALANSYTAAVAGGLAAPPPANGSSFSSSYANATTVLLRHSYFYVHQPPNASLTVAGCASSAASAPNSTACMLVAASAEQEAAVFAPGSAAPPPLAVLAWVVATLPVSAAVFTFIYNTVSALMTDASLAASGYPVAAVAAQTLDFSAPMLGIALSANGAAALWSGTTTMAGAEALCSTTYPTCVALSWSGAAVPAASATFVFTLSASTATTSSLGSNVVINSRSPLYFAQLLSAAVPSMSIVSLTAAGVGPANVSAWQLAAAALGSNFVFSTTVGVAFTSSYNLAGAPTVVQTLSPASATALLASNHAALAAAAPSLGIVVSPSSADFLAAISKILIQAWTSMSSGAVCCANWSSPVVAGPGPRAAAWTFFVDPSGGSAAVPSLAGSSATPFVGAAAQAAVVASNGSLVPAGWSMLVSQNVSMLTALLQVGRASTNYSVVVLALARDAEGAFGLSMQAVKVCPAGSVASSASANATCVACLPGRFSSAVGVFAPATCAPCAAGIACSGGTVSNTTTCPSSYFCPAGAAPIACANGTTSPPGSNASAACQVPPSATPSPSFSPSPSPSPTPSLSLSPSPSLTSTPTVSPSPSAITCPPGSTLVVGLNGTAACALCPSGFASSGTGGPCVQCAAGFACGPGAALNSTLCPASFYCPLGSAPVACASGLLSSPGASSPSDCQAISAAAAMASLGNVSTPAGAVASLSTISSISSLLDAGANGSSTANTTASALANATAARSSVIAQLGGIISTIAGGAAVALASGAGNISAADSAALVNNTAIAISANTSALVASALQSITGNPSQLTTSSCFDALSAIANLASLSLPLNVLSGAVDALGAAAGNASTAGVPPFPPAVASSLLVAIGNVLNTSALYTTVISSNGTSTQVANSTVQGQVTVALRSLSAAVLRSANPGDAPASVVSGSSAAFSGSPGGFCGQALSLTTQRIALSALRGAELNLSLSAPISPCGGSGGSGVVPAPTIVAGAAFLQAAASASSLFAVASSIDVVVVQEGQSPLPQVTGSLTLPAAADSGAGVILLDPSTPLATRVLRVNAQSRAGSLLAITAAAAPMHLTLPLLAPGSGTNASGTLIQSYTRLAFNITCPGNLTRAAAVALLQANVLPAVSFFADGSPAVQARSAVTTFLPVLAASSSANGVAVMQVNCGELVGLRNVTCAAGKSGLPFTVTFKCPVLSVGGVCAFWNVAASAWSSAGCVTVSSSNASITCACNHTTEFAARFGALGAEQQSIFGAGGLALIENPGAELKQYPHVFIILGCILVFTCVSLLITSALDREADGRFYESLRNDKEIQFLARIENLKGSVFVLDRVLDKDVDAQQERIASARLDAEARLVAVHEGITYLKRVEQLPGELSKLLDLGYVASTAARRHRSFLGALNFYNKCGPGASPKNDDAVVMQTNVLFRNAQQRVAASAASAAAAVSTATRAAESAAAHAAQAAGSAVSDVHVPAVISSAAHKAEAAVAGAAHSTAAAVASVITIAEAGATRLARTLSTLTDAYTRAIYKRLVRSFDSFSISGGRRLELLFQSGAVAGVGDDVADLLGLHRKAASPTPTAEAATEDEPEDAASAAAAAEADTLDSVGGTSCSRAWALRYFLLRTWALRVTFTHPYISIFTKYDPHLSRSMRMLVLTATLIADLWTTAFLYAFQAGSNTDAASSPPLSLSETVVVAVLSSLLQVPIGLVIVSLAHAAGRAEFSYRYPFVSAEIARRREVEQQLCRLSHSALEAELKLVALEKKGLPSAHLTKAAADGLIDAETVRLAAALGPQLVIAPKDDTEGRPSAPSGAESVPYYSFGWIDAPPDCQKNCPLLLRLCRRHASQKEAYVAAAKAAEEARRSASAATRVRVKADGVRARIGMMLGSTGQPAAGAGETTEAAPIDDIAADDEEEEVEEDESAPSDTGDFILAALVCCVTACSARGSGSGAAHAAQLVRTASNGNLTASSRNALATLTASGASVPSPAPAASGGASARLTAAAAKKGVCGPVLRCCRRVPCSAATVLSLTVTWSLVAFWLWYVAAFGTTHSDSTTLSFTLAWISGQLFSLFLVQPAMTLLIVVMTFAVWPAWAPYVVFLPVVGPLVAGQAAHSLAADDGGKVLSSRLENLTLVRAAGAASSLPPEMAVVAYGVGAVLGAAMSGVATSVQHAEEQRRRLRDEAGGPSRAGAAFRALSSQQRGELILRHYLSTQLQAAEAARKRTRKLAQSLAFANGRKAAPPPAGAALPSATSGTAASSVSAVASAAASASSSASAALASIRPSGGATQRHLGRFSVVTTAEDVAASLSASSPSAVLPKPTPRPHSRAIELDPELESPVVSPFLEMDEGEGVGESKSRNSSARASRHTPKAIFEAKTKRAYTAPVPSSRALRVASATTAVGEAATPPPPPPPPPPQPLHPHIPLPLHAQPHPPPPPPEAEPALALVPLQPVVTPLALPPLPDSAPASAEAESGSRRAASPVPPLQDSARLNSAEAPPAAAAVPAAPPAAPAVPAEAPPGAGGPGAAKAASLDGNDLLV